MKHQALRDAFIFRSDDVTLVQVSCCFLRQLCTRGMQVLLKNSPTDTSGFCSALSFLFGQPVAVSKCLSINCSNKGKCTLKPAVSCNFALPSFQVVWKAPEQKKQMDFVMLSVKFSVSRMSLFCLSLYYPF